MEGKPGNDYNGFVPLPPDLFTYVDPTTTAEDRLFNLISKGLFVINFP